MISSFSSPSGSTSLRVVIMRSASRTSTRLKLLLVSCAMGDQYLRSYVLLAMHRAAADTLTIPSRSVVCCLLTCLMRFADDKFRSRFLWGRKPMLAACAARLADRNNLVWVDLGGGTGVSSCP
jgi:hypothetical protein